MSGFKYELAAQVLAEAEVGRDDAVAAKYNITDRSIRRWRQRAAEDPALSSLVRQKKAEMSAQWAIQAGEWLQSLAVEAIKLARMPLCEAAGEKPSERLHACAGAFKIIAEAKIAWDMLGNASSSNGSFGQQDFEVAETAATAAETAATAEEED